MKSRGFGAGMSIRTDHKWHNFKYGYEVPKKVMRDQFDWMDEDQREGDQFILHNGHWYHLSDFMRLPKGTPIPGSWDGYAGDSYFSGMLIKVSQDGERYKIARYIA
jgi:hypothetical protein